MRSITLTAPAKVNLFLKILNKRRDGYHNLHTLFERISLADTIAISKIPEGIKVSSDKFITRKPEDNLVYKAAELIIARGVKKGLIRGKKGNGEKGDGEKGDGEKGDGEKGDGEKGGGEKGEGVVGKREKGDKGVKIRVAKKIPIAAGLGGGSSDAASVLMGINRLYNLKLKQKELISLGRKLGADVPFFLLNTPFAIGKGMGDELKKKNCKKRFYHLIIYPGFKLATKDVYAAFDAAPRHLTTGRPDDKIPTADMLYNDLEDIAIAKKNVLGHIIKRLAYSLGKKAIVSGSGPSIFCLYRTREEAAEAKRKLFRVMPADERKLWQVFVARTAV